MPWREGGGAQSPVASKSTPAITETADMDAQVTLSFGDAVGS